MTVSPSVSPKVLDKLQGNLSSYRLLQILIKPTNGKCLPPAGRQKLTVFLHVLVSQQLY